MLKTEQKPSEIQLAKLETEMSVWKTEISKVVLKYMTVGSVFIGSSVTLVKTGDLLQSALGGLVSGTLAGGMRIGCAFIKPLGKRAEEEAEDLGNMVVPAAKRQWTDRQFDEHYWDCQALECRSAKSSGIPQYEGIFVSLLEKVFVDLTLHGSAQNAGYGRTLENSEGRGEPYQIWDLLKRAEKNPEFGRIALLAWGGYGKTMLMRHVAYMYSKDKQRQVERKIPILIILGQYRELLSGQDAPDLATFIEAHRIPDLPGGENLPVPEKWGHTVLKNGRAVIMLDGFDEVPQHLQPGLVKWINEQTKRYPKSIFILTSRPKSYKVYREQNSEQFSFPTAYWVQEFNDRQRRDFIDRWYLCQEVYAHGGEDNAAIQKTAKIAANDLCQQIDQRFELKDMAKNPLLLTMMTTFHRRNNGADLPRRRVELYQEICRLQLKERPKARNLETVLLNCEAQDLLQPLALEMMKRQSRLLHKDLVLANLKTTLTAMSEKIDAADFLEQVTNIGELLIRQEDEYEFAHLSFQEYLAAVEIVRTKQESLLYPYLNSSSEFADSWSRLMLLYVGLVNPTKLIREAIKQERIDLADQMYRETTKQIDDPALKAELERLLKQDIQDLKYTKLTAFLDAEDWRSADEETYRVMIKAVGKEEGQGFSQQDLEAFPCEDLVTIDRLWMAASNNRFGFSVQKKIWKKFGSPMSYDDNYKKFVTEVGWREGADLINYNDLQFSLLGSPEGGLPMFGWSFLGGLYVVRFPHLFSREEICEFEYPSALNFSETGA
jgi:GUN4-like/NACHT domain